MKDKLRERLEAVRVSAAKAATQSDYTAAGEKAIRMIPELLAILDAEGDGGAVPYGHEFYDASGIYHFIRGALPGYAQTKIVPLYTHPARSGVVSDEAWVVRSTSGNDFFYRDEKQALTTFHALMGSTISRFVQQEKAK